MTLDTHALNRIKLASIALRKTTDVGALHFKSGTKLTRREYTEEEVQDLTDCVFLLRERVQEGKISFAEHLVDDFFRSFQAIRLRHDGLVDPHSVDGRIRSATLAIRAMKYRQDAKDAISLSTIQSTYFDFLFTQFGKFYDQMTELKLAPGDYAYLASQQTPIVRMVMAGVSGLAHDLTEFWKAVEDSGAYHLQDSTQLKATFSGDLFPAHWENAVSTAGLYLDTIVLPCPVIRISPLIGSLPDQEVVRLLLKHVLTAMTYRSIVEAEVDPPIAVVMPNVSDLEVETQQSVVERAKPETLKHAQYLFHRQFESIEHLKEFCESLKTVDQALAAIKGGDRLIFDTEWGGGPREQLERAVSERIGIFPGLDPSIAGSSILSYCVGRMPQALAAQEYAFHLGGTPFINAETSWKYYTWFLDYQGQSKPTTQSDNREEASHVVRALVSEADNNLGWLGNVPPETIVEIRKQGLSEEVRAILGQGIPELINADRSNYFRTADQVVDNLDRAFRKHQQDLRDARNKKLKLYGLDVGSCLAAGTLGVAAAITSNVGLGVASSLVGMAGLPNLKDIKSKFQAISEEDRLRRTSPTGLLFKHLR